MVTVDVGRVLASPAAAIPASLDSDWVFAAIFLLFFAGACAVALRPRWNAARAAQEARAGYAVSARRHPLAEWIGVVAATIESVPRSAVLRELKQGLVAILLLLCFVGASSWIGLGFRWYHPLSLAMLGIAVAGVFFGTRPALLAGGVGAISLGHSLFLPALFPPAGTERILVDLLVLCTGACFFGGYADRVREDRRISAIYIEKSHALFDADSEAAIRKILHGAVVSLLGTSATWVVDALAAPSAGSGQPVPMRLVPAMADMKPDTTLTMGRWRIRPLALGLYPIGAVIWPALKGSAVRPSGADEAIRSLSDLAIAAIGRARLTAEHGQAELLAKTEKLRGALLASLSHDFRTPLAGILGSATSLLDLGDQYDGARRRDLLQNIKEQTLRLNRYIENLLSMTRLESGALPVKLRPALVEPLVYEAWETLNDFGAATRLLKVRFDIEAAASLDPVLFHQALVNVFENAIKYSPDGSTVHVHGSRSGNVHHLEIWDEGPGVKPNEASLLFDRFYRVQGTSKSGAGLGLHIVKSIIEAMRGTIKARSGSNGQNGLCIDITLAAADLVE